MTTLDYALRYLDVGLSIIPIRRDGSKAPDSRLLPTVRGRSSWAPFQAMRPAPSLARSWWGGHLPPGIAAVGGMVSGGLELLDFDLDAGPTYSTWADLVLDERPRLLDQVSIVLTPREPAGYHVWLRCPDLAGGVPGNHKLASLSEPEVATERAAAKAEGRKAETTLIETRGAGGYALLPGCPPECHPSRRCYVWHNDLPLWHIPAISPEEREVLHRCARSFTRLAPEEVPPRQAAIDGALLPGADFDRRGPDWEQLLGPHGWRCVARAGHELRWRRPGKDSPGWSATTGHCRGQDGADLLRVFSSNAHPFEDGKAYGKFRALALLEHGGDWRAAARALAQRGYGDRRPRQRLPMSDVERVLRVCREHPGLVWDALLEDLEVVQAVRARLMGGGDL